ncbi:MAG: SMC-Scp complex subunit ScpB, partial [Parvibaculales bacterium]
RSARIVAVNDDLPDTPEGEDPKARELRRALEALLLVSEEPLTMHLAAQLLEISADTAEGLCRELAAEYDATDRGFQLVSVAGGWRYQTHPDTAPYIERFVLDGQSGRLSNAALETLAIIAYHQPVTRAEIEDIRGVSISKGTLDVLLESEWVKIRGRRRVPGRPVTYGTSDQFLLHFGLESLTDLPGLEELKAAGLLDDRLPPGFEVPAPDPDSDPDEDPLAEGDDGSELEPLEMDLPDGVTENAAEDGAAP